MRENPIRSAPGFPYLFGVLAAVLLAGWLLASGIGSDPDANGLASPARIVGAVLLALIALLSLIGLYTVQPNQAAVLSLFGKYVGTVKDNGLRWNNPFYAKRKVSQRVRNFESGKLKVNELDGSPIEIAAVIVWQVIDSAEAVYNVDDYESFVQIQSESALRTMATSYPYDQHEDGQLALRSRSTRCAVAVVAADAHDVRGAASIEEVAVHGVGQVRAVDEVTEALGELGPVGDQRRLVGWAFLGKSDEGGDRCTDSLYRLRPRRHLLHVDAGRQISRHGWYSFVGRYGSCTADPRPVDTSDTEVRGTRREGALDPRVGQCGVHEWACPGVR